MRDAGAAAVGRRWAWLVLLVWLAAAVWLLDDRWNAIRAFALLDTDDNLRIAQVRAWLAGQGWYDLRQYRLDPPAGADIHWSRLADLPLAAIKLALTPVTGGASAEKAAVALAPLLPMLVAMLALAAAVRRLLPRWTFILAVGLLLCAAGARGMWSPLRIDHHGWQLAMLSLVLLGLVDRRPARGGVVAGAASAASLAIGLEMLLYLALAGALTGLVWLINGERRRLAAYGVSLAGGTALAYLAFASNANAAPVCDALSPVWLSVMTLAGALSLLLALAPARGRWARLALAAGAVAALALFYALVWPHCLGRLEGVSAEADRLWLSRVREARPLYSHDWRVIAGTLMLPLAGAAGYALMLWRNRRDPGLLAAWAMPAALALLALALLLWQTRAGPAAQMLAVPGATALAWALIAWGQARSGLIERVVIAIVAVLLVSGAALQAVMAWIPREDRPGGNAVRLASGRCPSLAALHPIALLPRGLVLTHVDLGPRLIAVTRHDAITGPYHRNDAAIVAVMRAFRGAADNARRTITARGVDYVLICPNLPETTIYRSQAPDGFYTQLVRGRVPGWLEPVALPRGSPYRMWRVRR